MRVGNIELDDDNRIFNLAADFVEHTDRNIFLTGKAGTGKTTFLRYIREKTKKRMVVLAPTGVAAINAGGQTVHSFFQLGRGVYLPDDIRLRRSAPKDETDRRTIADFFRYNNDKMRLMKSLELLVIDEISMLRCDLLDAIDRLLRWVREWDTEPFGGVQMLLIGDTFQLPPIASGEEWKILERFYDSPFFFNSQIVREKPLLYIELQKIYRQTDRNFIDLLNKIRVNTQTDKDLMLLNQRYLPDFQPAESETYITLASHNRIVDDINRTRLTRLPTAEKTFEAIVTGIFPPEIMPTAQTLRLKEGAQVMFVRNNLPQYCNGTMGRIASMEDDILLVALDNGETIPVEMTEWSNIRFVYNRKENRIEEEIIGTFEQYPLRLAWAITVHKSQGLTFDRVIADVGGAFTHGQVYVALSRCSNFDGLALRSRIGKEAIRANPQALLYARNATAETDLPELLEQCRAEIDATRSHTDMVMYQPDMPVEELFDRINSLFNDPDMPTDKRIDNLTSLIAKNTTTFAKRTCELKWSAEDTMLFVYFCHLLVNGSYDTVTLADIEELFDVKRDWRRVRLSFINKSFPAFNERLIALEGKYYKLTAKSRRKYLTEILKEAVESPLEHPSIIPPSMEKASSSVSPFEALRKMPENTVTAMMRFDAIAEKHLYFNDAERQQVDSLVKLLASSNFRTVQQRLEAAGMRRGFACLFYGAPGTGKTETVYQIARQTERNVLMVNISETKSKWFGQSEKRIKEIFQEYRIIAEKSDDAPILLFNEADAVIGKRHEGSDAAIYQTENAMQNILLQEMENFDGIMIATTNLTGNLDHAFERRFLYKVEFHKPTAETRCSIWLTLIPSLNPADAATLAGQYDFSGGEIENISRKYTVENILRGDTLTIDDLHRFCREEKLVDPKQQRPRVGF
jgi:AAA+ superfamily predicted ATPase